MSVTIKVQRLAHGADLPLPAYETADAAGMDLRAATGDDLTLPPGGFLAVPTGLCLEIPQGYEGQVRPRSGLAARHGVTVLNSPGTIDADYRGEVKVLLVNHGTESFTITRGLRIAQLVIAPVLQAQLIVTEAVSPSGRGSGGFGSTGVK
ncbi:MAG: dUTP diphosphatase [Hyphomicrobiaceae bacterium]|nr:dUTP diphosphatase [Hyphomicrobiaceae bacterium]